jgi:hypothetical protein
LGTRSLRERLKLSKIIKGDKVIPQNMSPFKKRHQKTKLALVFPQAHNKKKPHKDAAGKWLSTSPGKSPRQAKSARTLILEC